MKKIIALGFLLTAKAIAGDSSPHYTIVIDAGSSGSRLHLFEYRTNKRVPVIHDLFSEKATPGLSSFADHPDQAPASIQKLLDDANNELAKRKIDPQKVTINILATAGMRLLPESSQQAIYTNIKQYITAHYEFKPERIETISGKMEGIYGWLDINYLARNFNADQDITMGSIDMGGASTQIAYSTNAPRNTDDEIKMRIGFHTYTVISESFLGLGQDQAHHSIAQDSAASACYPTNYSVSDNVKGDFNFATCKNLYLDFINQKQIMQTLPPMVHQHFVAYSGIYHVDHFLNVENAPEQANVEKRIQEVCSQSWEQLKAAYPSIPEKWLANYCSNSVYDSALIYDTYHLEGRQLTVTTQINGVDIDWTLGAVLYELVH